MALILRAVALVLKTRYYVPQSVTIEVGETRPVVCDHDEGVMEKAWSGGEGGLETLRPFLARAKDHLLPGGRAVVLLCSEMDQEALDLLLKPYERERLAARRLFFEELWVERLTPR